MNRKSLSRVFLVVLTAGLAVSPSLAQPDRPPPMRDDPMGGPLGGPSVRDRDVPGVAGSFGNDADGQKRKFANRIPPRAMREAMGVVMNEDAPDDIRATPEQREKIRGYYTEFQQQMRDFVQEHRKELEDLRDKMPRGGAGGPAGEIFRMLDQPNDRRGPGGPDRDRRRARPDDAKPAGARPADAMNDQPEQRAGKARRGGQEVPVEVREQLRALASQMPQFEDVYTKIWAELTPEQQKAVDGRLAEFRDRQAKEREDDYVKKRVNARRGEPAGQTPPPPRRRPADGARIQPGGPGAPDGPGANIPADRRARLMRIFERMSPEQQEQLLSRLEARLRDEGGAPQPPARRRPGRPAPGEPRPMPDMDHMPTPPMDEMNAPPRPPRDRD